MDANQVYRDFNTDGVPSSGLHKPVLEEIRDLLTGYEGDLEQVRTGLAADRIYYVRADGSDSNDGMSDSAGGAFLTLQKAADVVADTIDTRGFNVTVQARTGTYASARLTGPITGGGTLTFLGNTAAANFADVQVVGGFYATRGAAFFVRGIKISSTAAGNWSLYAQGTGSCITWSQLNFGAVTGGGDHMIATDHGTLINDDASPPYIISGGALNHYHATECGFIRIAGQGVVVTGTPNFTGQFAGVATGNLVVIGVFYTGSATGKTYLVHLNGAIRSSLDTRNVFPGDLNGQEQSGGRLDQASQFNANKNNVDQVIANGGWVKVTMGTLPNNVGSDYNVGLSRWTPRMGSAYISATVTFSLLNAINEICGVSIFKNGAEYRSVLFNSTGGTTKPQSATVSFMEPTTTGADVYEVYARGGDTGNSTVEGDIRWTYWTGRQF